MANIADFVPAVAALVPDAPNPAIKQQARDTFYEFCRQTRVWAGDIFPTDTTEGESTIFLSTVVPGNARVYEVLTLSRDRKPMEGGDFHRAQQLRLRETGRPRLFDHLPNDQLKMYPTPDKAYTLTGEVVLVPRKTSDVVEQWIFDDFEFGIRHGIIYALTSMINKPWTSPEQAQQSLGHFTREMDHARARAENRHQSKDRVVKYGGL